VRRLALCAVLAVELVACKHKGKLAAKKAEAEAAGPMLSVLRMNDPAAEAQLARGFYGLEARKWRWTSSKFAVKLDPPENSASRGAILKFEFSLPEAVVKQTGPVTLSASVNGSALAPVEYAKPGEYTYTSDLPSSFLRPRANSLEFTTDKALPPSGGDKRELALVATSIGLLPK
jgi:hypothetical protein